MSTTHSEQIQQSDDRPRQARIRRLSKALDGCLVRSVDSPHSQQDAASVHLKRMFFSLVDNVVIELKSRFNTSNTSLSLAVSALLPGADNHFSQLSEGNLSPLTALMQPHQQFDSNAFTAELTTARSMLNRKLRLLQGNKDLQQTALCMLPYKDAFPQLYWHYAAALTIGVSTATCKKNLFFFSKSLRRQSDTVL